MHVAVMPPPGAHAAQPGLPPMVGAEAALDGGVDQQAVEPRGLRRDADQGGVAWRPAGGVHRRFVGQDEGGDRQFLPLRSRYAGLGAKVEPDIGVQPGLMAGMAPGQGAAAGLRQIADPEVGQARQARLAGDMGDERDGGGMPPVTVAAGPDGLPARPFRRQGDGAGDAAEVGGADGPRGAGRGARQRRPVGGAGDGALRGLCAAAG